MGKKQLMFDRRTHNLLTRGIEAIEKLGTELERYNDNEDADEPNEHTE